MKLVIILTLLISFNSSAEYRVAKFGDFCIGSRGCVHETKQICEDWLVDNHPAKPLSSCLDITVEEQTKRTTKTTRDSAARVLAKKVANGLSLTANQKDKMILFLFRKLEKMEAD